MTGYFSAKGGLFQTHRIDSIRSELIRLTTLSPRNRVSLVSSTC